MVACLAFIQGGFDDAKDGAWAIVLLIRLFWKKNQGWTMEGYSNVFDEEHLERKEQ